MAGFEVARSALPPGEEPCEWRDPRRPGMSHGAERFLRIEGCLSRRTGGGSEVGDTTLPGSWLLSILLSL